MYVSLASSRLDFGFCLCCFFFKALKDHHLLDQAPGGGEGQEIQEANLVHDHAD